MKSERRLFMCKCVEICVF